MIKIPTLFQRDETQRGHPVVDRVTPGCEWVLIGEGLPTIKLDGQNVKIERGQFYKRQKPASGDYDEASYIRCLWDAPDDRYLWEAFDALPLALAQDGIYEAVGPKIQGNPSRYATHTLVRVYPPLAGLKLYEDVRRTFDGLRDYLSAHTYEGLVFHHPDGRLCKIKRRDYGLPWPPKIDVLPHLQSSDSAS